MADSYFWRGNYISGNQANNINTNTPERDRLAYVWNRKENWLVRREGITFADGGSGGSGDWDGGSTGDFHLAPASRPPGGGDHVRFECINNTNGITYSLPLTPCLFGGFWGENDGKGWIGAGNTSDKLKSLVVDRNYGYSFGNCSGADHTQFHASGTFLAGIVEMGQGGNSLGGNNCSNDDGDFFRTDHQAGFIGMYDGFRYLLSGQNNNGWIDSQGRVGPGTDGVTFGIGNTASGLRILAETVIANPNAPFSINLIDSQVDFCSLRGTRLSVQLQGGTYEQVVSGVRDLPFRFVNVAENQEADANKSILTFEALSDDLGYDRHFGTDKDFTITDTLSLGDFTRTNYEPRVADSIIGKYYISRLVLHPKGTVPNVIINSEYRPGRTKISGIYTNFYLYPQRNEFNRSQSLGGFPANAGQAYGNHRPITFGLGGISGDTNTQLYSITNLFLREDPDGNTYRAVINANESFFSFDPINSPSEGRTYEGYDVVGSNNLFLIDGLGETGGFTCENLQLEAGKVALGDYLIYMDGRGDLGESSTHRAFGDESYRTSLTDTNRVTFNKGSIYTKSSLDLGVRGDGSNFKNAKVGPGVSHPTEAQGLKVITEGGFVRLPSDIRFVADYEAADQGATGTIDPNKPRPIFGFAPSGVPGGGG